MRVLFISHEASKTGAPIALLQELLFLKDHCKDVSFELLLLEGGPLMDSFKEICLVHQGWRHYTLLSRILRKFWKKRIDHPYLYHFKKEQFDVIYANTVVSFKVAIELKRKFGIPLIGHVHEAENLFRAYNLKKEEVDSFDKLIAVSELSAKNLIDMYGLPSDKIVIQHPISHWVGNLIERKIKVCPIEKYQSKFLIGLFCNGGWWKATEIIPFVIKSFYEKYPLPECEFVVVGNISELTRYHLNYDLRKMNVQRNIHWVGVVDNPLDYHARFDVFLLISREESFSLAAQEAAIMETPIIGFEGVTGAAEWIRDGAGTLVPYMDFARISEEIYNYFIDVQLRRDTGKKAKKIVTCLYEKDSQMSNILALFNEYGGIDKDTIVLK